MSAIIKRELGAYFTSAIGYVVIAVFFFFAGLFFTGVCLNGDTSSMTYVISNMFVIVLFLIPILTMRLLSEDKKQKTDQALFTAPISLTKIAMGKYLSAVIVYALCLVVFVLEALVIACFTTPDWAVLLCSLLGMFLLGAALIAIGMFISSLTESQVLAAVGGMAVGLAIYMIDQIASLSSITFLNDILKKLSFTTHYQNFTIGVLNITDIVFFLSVCALFVFLTVRVFEKKRWS